MIGRDLKNPLVPTPAASRDTFHWTRVLTGPSSLAWSTSRDGASTPSLGCLWQCLYTLAGNDLLCLRGARKVSLKKPLRIVPVMPRGENQKTSSQPFLMFAWEKLDISFLLFVTFPK